MFKEATQQKWKTLLGIRTRTPCMSGSSTALPSANNLVLATADSEFSYADVEMRL
ncbi:hypothetical protein D3C86_1917480 [compost metagenome]